ncbi:enoyl-CoA hydratase-related protein [Salinibacillus xinjiangensis]|uniref:enoyl-CoA hydratase-related protein n=1 Tax=Salinibacillus xinjiangensis TaxID=1229268 RepID=UPI001E55E2A4|nr:enoyl-CoA hydratase-related protein [Salinibacillus xinjiangensis]
MPETIRTELKQGILTVFLNRPGMLNAYNSQMKNELVDIYQKADKDDEVRVVIVTGMGKAFCAGKDLHEGSSTFATDDDLDSYRLSGGELSMVVYLLKKPIIAAINGPAVGIGLTMTLPMDIRVVKRNTKIGFNFAKLGLGPEAASGWFLPQIVGIGKALEWVYTGRFIPTSEALQHGLVNYEEDDPLEKAYEIARDIVTNTAATSNSFSRQLLWKMLGEHHPYTSHLIESKYFYWAGNSEDAKEGVQSFLDKRPVKFPLKGSDLPDFFNVEKEEKNK